MKKIVWAKIPRAGLANKILVWANALCYAKRHNSRFVTTNWLSVFIGPLLRKEKSLRFYKGYFKQDSFFIKIYTRLLAQFLKVEKNPKKIDAKSNAKIVCFDKYMFWIDFFDNIRSDRVLVKDTFYKSLLKPKILNEVNAKESPMIAVHIRMGDFQKHSSKENFNWKETLLEQTPLDYFCDVIHTLRDYASSEISVKIFSDGSPDELSEVLKIKNTELVTGNKDIVDLLMIAKSKVIVTSATSTFSLLAGFLSKAVLIHHPNFYIRNIRPDEVDAYEGPFDKSLKLKEAIHTTFANQ